MEPVAIGDLRSEYYDVNSDFPGLWELDENRREDVDFRNSSSIRIWYNDLTSNFATHWHNALEIIIPIDNYYDVEVEGISYHLRPDEILIIPPGKLHQLTAPSSGSRFIYLLDISCLEGLKGFSGIKSLLTAPLFVTKESYSHIYEDVYDLLARMRNEYFRKNEYAELTIYALLINLFVKFGYNHIQTQDLFPNVRSYKQKEYVKKFNDLLDYIDKHYTEELNLETASDSVNIIFQGFLSSIQDLLSVTTYAIEESKLLNCCCQDRICLLQKWPCSPVSPVSPPSTILIFFNICFTIISICLSEISIP